MNIRRVIWLPDVEEKIWRKHHVTADEAEEVFGNAPWFTFVEKGQREGEDVYAAWGQSDGGRYLIVFFIWKRSHDALIVSARDMTQKERRRYEKER